MAFKAPHIHPPQAPHTHTAIMLHGRGSNGPDFKLDLFSSSTTATSSSGGQNLAAALPSWRWVFPTSRERWNTNLRFSLSAWFDAYSLTSPSDRQDLQVEGLAESVVHVLDIIDKEIGLLGGQTEKVFLGGISQGMATALWTLLCSPARLGAGQRLGGCLAFCGWLPFSDQIEAIIHLGDNDTTSMTDDSSKVTRVGKAAAVSKFLLDTIGHPSPPEEGAIDFARLLLSTPVFLSHGTDDPFVDVRLGQQVRGLLTQLGFQVEWREYFGADNEGHWIKEPEAFDDIVRFLKDTSAGSC